MFAPRDHDFPRRLDTIPRNKSRKARIATTEAPRPALPGTGRDLPRRAGRRVMTEKALTKKLSGTLELTGAPKAHIVSI